MLYQRLLVRSIMRLQQIFYEHCSVESKQWQKGNKLRARMRVWKGARGLRSSCVVLQDGMCR